MRIPRLSIFEVIVLQLCTLTVCLREICVALGTDLLEYAQVTIVHRQTDRQGDKEEALRQGGRRVGGGKGLGWHRAGVGAERGAL